MYVTDTVPSVDIKNVYDVIKNAPNKKSYNTVAPV